MTRFSALIAAALALAPIGAFAQDTTHVRPPKPPFTKDQYVEFSKERAATIAAARFDEMDTDKDGTVDAAEFAAYRKAHPYPARPAAPAPDPN